MAKIKICGITNISDALLACKLGADAIGFVFAKSPRKISIETAKKIILKMPPFVSKVGVFSKQDVEFINNAVKKCRLDYVQLHGDETADFCRKINANVIKAFRVFKGFNVDLLKDFKDFYILLDTFSNEVYGGTGTTFDWNVALKAKKICKNLILSGGLNEKNLSKALKIVRPWAVDLSSGVEISPGKKSAEKLKKVISIVKWNL